jgi:hypothetical protein
MSAQKKQVQIKQFGSMLDLMRHFDTEQKCIDHLTKLRWGGNVISPYDKDSKVYVCKGNKYKCKNTGKYFNVKTGTFFDDSKIPLQKWFVALWLMSSHKKGISSHQLAKDIGVTQKTAWYMLHRLRNTFGHDSYEKPLEGTVEADETYYGGKDSNKHKNKKLLGSQKAIVVGALQRGGNVKAAKIRYVGFDATKFVVDNVVKGSVLFTDEARHYVKMCEHGYTHRAINHSQGQYVDGYIHTNTIEGFWSLFKRGVEGIYHHISDKHLNKYLIEYSFRYNTREFAEMIRFNYILTNVSNTKMSYNTLIQKKDGK